MADANYFENVDGIARPGCNAVAVVTESQPIPDNGGRYTQRTRQVTVVCRGLAGQIQTEQVVCGELDADKDRIISGQNEKMSALCVARCAGCPAFVEP